METIVLDYCSGKVTILSHDDYQDIEMLLIDRGFDLNDCEWMTTNKIIIPTQPQQYL